MWREWACTRCSRGRVVFLAFRRVLSFICYPATPVSVRQGLARMKDTTDHSTRRSELNSWIAENEGLAGYSKIFSNTMDPSSYKIVLVELRPQKQGAFKRAWIG